jgi:hypothetical protein
VTTVQDVAEELRRLGHLSEWLLHDVRWIQFGFAIEILFNNVFDESGVVREDALGRPHLTAIRLSGVQTFSVSNNLSTAMLDEPDQIDWGLSEVARVQAEEFQLPDRLGVRLEILWDGPRRVEAVAAAIEIMTRA